MSKAWMPLYVGDFIADTTHLSATETGIYIRLIMHCWQHGRIPRDDKMLARIAHCDARLWRQYKETVLQFFYVDNDVSMQHKRVDKELRRSEEISNKRKEAALQKHSKSSAKAEQLHTQSQSQSHKEDRIGEAASVFTQESKALSSALWAALDYNTPLQIPPELAGADWRAISWAEAGWTPDLIAVEAKRIGPGKPLIYYEKVFATAFAKRQTPLPVVEVKEAEKLTVVNHGRPKSAIIQAADDLVRRLASFDGPAGEPDELRSAEGQTPPRLLSNR